MLSLQGLNVVQFREPLSTVSETMKRKMAGNAFNFHTFALGFACALTMPIGWFTAPEASAV